MCNNALPQIKPQTEVVTEFWKLEYQPNDI